MAKDKLDIEAAYDRLVERFKKDICSELAAKAEQTAKDNAPWTDRTGDARRLLKGQVIADDDTMGIRLLHRVEYGKHLETAHDGKYAILKPVIEQYRPILLERLRRVFGK